MEWISNKEAWKAYQFLYSQPGKTKAIKTFRCCWIQVKEKILIKKSYDFFNPSNHKSFLLFFMGKNMNLNFSLPRLLRLSIYLDFLFIFFIILMAKWQRTHTYNLDFSMNVSLSINFLISLFLDHCKRLYLFTTVACNLGIFVAWFRYMLSAHTKTDVTFWWNVYEYQRT